MPQRPDVLVQGIDPHPEGQLTLELGAAPGKHQMPAPPALGRQLREQTGLPDPGLPHHEHPSGPAAVERIHRTMQGGPLTLSADQRRGIPLDPGHNSPLRGFPVAETPPEARSLAGPLCPARDEHAL
jgi:hypothetical protein